MFIEIWSTMRCRPRLEILKVIQRCASILAQPRMLQKSLGLSVKENMIQRLLNKGITNNVQTAYFRKPFGNLSEAFERPPDRILRSKSAEIDIPHRSSVHSFKSLTLANLLSQETVYRSAAVHRRQPSYKKLRASFEVSCSWDQNTSDFIWISPIDCCAHSFSHLIAYLRPKGRGRKLVGQGACIERICVATFWMPFFELKSFDVADTLTAAYHGILAHMHHNHSNQWPSPWHPSIPASTLRSEYCTCQIQSAPTKRDSVEPLCNHQIEPLSLGFSFLAPVRDILYVYCLWLIYQSISLVYNPRLVWPSASGPSFIMLRFLDWHQRSSKSNKHIHPVHPPGEG